MTVVCVCVLGIYLTLSMAMTSISVILTVGVLKLHHSGPHQTRVPPWMRTLILHGLASLVHCRWRAHKPKSKFVCTKEARDGADMCLRLVNEVTNGRRSPVFSSPARPAPYTPTTAPSNKHEPRFHHNALGDHGHVEDSAVSNKRATPRQTDIANDIRRLNVMEEILRYLQIMVTKKDADDAEMDIMTEWRQVAKVIDRFLFLLFLTVTLSATVIIMVLIPFFSKR